MNVVDLSSEQLISALRLPTEASVGQRIPKKMLTDNLTSRGAATSADRKLLQEQIDEVTWVAALKPTNAGIPVYQDEVRSYLDDFIENVQVGLTAVWSNCVGFPPSRALIHEGATHGPEFKAWARASMHPTLVWYQAYPTLGVTDIDLNSRVRRGLRPGTEDQHRWLSQL